MVVTYGEALVDLIEQDDGNFAPMLGGSVANFTMAVARQGLGATYLNPLSFDTFGARFASHLGGAGVTLASRRSKYPTALAVVTLDAQKVPSYAFHRAQVADRDMTLADACAALPPSPALFHTGGLALVPEDLETTLAVATAAARAGARISIDANLRPLAAPDLASYARGVRRALALAHLVKVSEEDLRYLGHEGVDPVAAARTLFDGTATQLVALTLGDAGAVLLSHQATVAVPVPAGVRVVDTVGAGDCFQAGLVASLIDAGALRNLDQLDAAALDRALRYAVATASINVMRKGCDPPLRTEVEQFIRTRGEAA